MPIPADTVASSRPGPRSADAGLTVRLALAADFARDGCYGEAERCLGSGDGWGALRPAMLDLRGRIMAQQGRYLEAEACWLEAVRLDPGEAAYRAALDAIHRQRLPLLWLRPLAAGMVLALACAGLGYSLGGRPPDPQAQAAEIRAIRCEMERERETMQRLEDTVRHRPMETKPARPADHSKGARGPLG
jgi:hypothetical protein